MRLNFIRAVFLRAAPPECPPHPFSGSGPRTRAIAAASAAPPARLARQLRAAGPGEGVEPRLAVVGRDAPLRGDPALGFEPLQRGVERAVVHQQLVARRLLDRARDALAVLGPENEGAEDEDVERALQQGEAVGISRVDI